MAEINDDLMTDLVFNINKLVKAFGGEGNSPIGNNNSKMRSPLPVLSQAIHHTHRTVKLMHGGVDDFVGEIESLAYGMKRHTNTTVVALGTLGTALVGAFKGIMALNAHFGKMADIGQVFQGSLFEMARSAGQAGLSVDQYTKFLTKNSMVTSAIGAKSMGAWQMQVRKTLEPMGNFGLSLEEIDDVVSDYGETMRQNGVLSKLNESQRTKAVTDMIDQASQMAGVFGRSRTEIMKTTNEAMRQTNFAGRVQTGTPEQAAAAQAYVTAFAGMSDTLAKTYAEQYGKGGYVDTDLGKALIGSALGDINTVIQSGIDDAKAGIKPTSKKIASDFNYIAGRFNAVEMNRLEALSKIDDNARKTLEFAVQFRANFDKFKNMDVDAMARYIDTQREMQRQRDAITKSAGVFEDMFKTITGSFLEGFYGALERILGDRGSKGLTGNLQKFGEIAKAVGTSVGNLLGSLLSPTAIAYYKEAFKTIRETVTKLLGWLTSPEGESAVKGIWHTIEWLAVGLGKFASVLGNFIPGFSGDNTPGAGGNQGLGDKQGGIGSWLPQISVLFGGMAMGRLLDSIVRSFFHGTGTAGMGRFAFGGIGSRVAGVLTGGMLRAPFTIAAMFARMIPLVGPLLAKAVSLLGSGVEAVGQLMGSSVFSLVAKLLGNPVGALATIGLGAGVAAYFNGQHEASAADAAAKQGFTEGVGMQNGDGSFNLYKNPKTGQVKSFMDFDPRYAKALKKTNAPSTPPTPPVPSSPGSTAPGAILPNLPNDNSLPDPSGIFKLSDDYWAKLAKDTTGAANPTDPAQATVELLKKLVYLQAVQVRQQKDSGNVAAIMAAEAQRYSQ